MSSLDQTKIKSQVLSTSHFTLKSLLPTYSSLVSFSDRFVVVITCIAHRTILEQNFCIVLLGYVPTTDFDTELDADSALTFRFPFI